MGSDGVTQALVAQRIRASDYGSEGREFESLQARFETAFWQFFFDFFDRQSLLPTIQATQRCKA